MKQFFLLSLLLFLAGCMVGPRYSEPETAMPTAFDENIGAEVISDEELCQWWKQFGDPLLDSLIEEAAQANFDLRIALEQIAEARAQFQVQSSTLWPEIDLNAVATRSRFSQNVFTTASNAASIASGNVASATRGAAGSNTPVQNFFQVGFDAIWELDFWGKFRHGKKAAFDQWEASQFNAQNVLLTIISEVVRDYVSIRALQQQIAVTKKRIESDERELALAWVLFDAGLDNKIQIDGFIAALESDKATLPPLETSLKQTVYALAILLGKQPENFYSLFEEVKPIPAGSGKVPAGLPSDLLRRRPDIRAAERQLAAATENIGVAVANLFPHISITGNGGGYEGNMLKNWLLPSSRYWTIGPSINWDLIDFGKTRGQIAIANSLERQAFLTYEQTVISSLQDVEGALVAYFEEQARNLYLVDQEAAHLSALALTEDLFQAGLADEFQVLEALKTLLTTENTLIQSNQALTSDLVALYKALGGNWECSSTH